MKIAITGGKGGTGKSTISTALAIELATGQNKVLLVDADVECPDDHIILSTNRKSSDIHTILPLLTKTNA